MADNLLLKAALWYAKAGFSVIPCNPPMKDEEGKDIKKPRISWTEFQKRRATEEEIEVWFTKWPDSRVGIVTGAISNLFVVDVDTEEAHQVLETEYLPETLLIPKVKSPRGGFHYYFQHQDGLRNKQQVDGIALDTRGDGGFIMAPPSKGLNGNGYQWVKGCELWKISPPPVPEHILAVLRNKAISISLRTGVAFSQETTETTETTEGDKTDPNEYLSFTKGTRDKCLFHWANRLVTGNTPREEAQAFLTLINQRLCTPPMPERELLLKIDSALKRKGDREKLLVDEVREWILATEGDFLATEVDKELGLATKGDKKHRAKILERFCEKGLIERHGSKRGSFRVINRQIVEQCWWEADGTPLPIQFPLGIHEFAKVFPGNVVLLEGQKSQGKSAFALEVCRLNKGLYPKKILYQNVEMSNDELNVRFTAYGDIMPKDEWRKSVTIIRQTSEWWDKVLPDGLNVIDYLIEYEKAYLIADYIWKIHQRLKSGIALIVVQRDPLKPYPAGGRSVRDIPRLVISLIRHKVRLEDVKSFHQTVYGNPTGLTRDYKQVQWWELRPDSPWEFEYEEKYKQFKK